MVNMRLEVSVINESRYNLGSTIPYNGSLLKARIINGHDILEKDAWSRSLTANLAAFRDILFLIRLLKRFIKS